MSLEDILEYAIEHTPKDKSRQELEKIDGERKTFIGTFEKYGLKSGWYKPERTILLINIKDETTDIIVSDHIWLTEGKRLKQLAELEKGDIIKFDARVQGYIKGYMGHREDVYGKEPTLSWKLSFANNFLKIGKPTEEKGIIK